MLPKLLSKALICLSIVFFIISCQQEVITPSVPNQESTQNNEEDSVTNTNNTSNNFFAKVDGVIFQETLLYAAESFVDVISITASENMTYPSINLNFPIDITVGSYTFSSSAGDYTGYLSFGTNLNDIFPAEEGAGNLIITNHDTANRFVEGTFSFTAVPSDNTMTTPTYSITEGAFSVNY